MSLGNTQHNRKLKNSTGQNNTINSINAVPLLELAGTELVREVNMKQIVSSVIDTYNTITYVPKHSHHIDWDATMHERGQLAFAVVGGLMIGFFMFAAMTM